MSRDTQLNIPDLDEAAMEAPLPRINALGIPKSKAVEVLIPTAKKTIAAQNLPYTKEEWKKIGSLEAPAFRLPVDPTRVPTEVAPERRFEPRRKKTPLVRATPDATPYVPVNLAQKSITPKVVPQSEPMTRAAAANAFSWEKAASKLVTTAVAGISSVTSTVGGWFSRGLKALSNGVKNTTTYQKDRAKEAMEAFIPDGKMAQRAVLAATALIGANNFGPTTSSLSLASDTAPIEMAGPSAMATSEEVKSISSNWVEKNADGSVTSSDFAKAETAKLQVLAKKLAPTLDLDELDAPSLSADSFTVTKEKHNGMGLLQALASASPEFNDALKNVSGLRTVVFSHVVDQLASQGVDANVLDLGTQISLKNNQVLLLHVDGTSLQFELIPGLDSSSGESVKPVEPAPEAELVVDPMDAPVPAPAPEVGERPVELDPFDAPLPGKLSPRKEVTAVKKEIRKTLLDSLGFLDIQPAILIDFAQSEEGGYVGTYTLQLPVRKEAEMGTVNFVHTVELGYHPYDWETNPKLAAKKAFLTSVQRGFVPFMNDVIEEHYDPSNLTLDETPEALLSRWQLEQSVSSTD